MHIDRIYEHSSVILTPYNIHRIIFVSIFMAIKYNEDICFEYNFYSKIAGIPMKEIKILEGDILF